MSTCYDSVLGLGIEVELNPDWDRNLVYITDILEELTSDYKGFDYIIIGEESECNLQFFLVDGTKPTIGILTPEYIDNLKSEMRVLIEKYELSSIGEFDLHWGLYVH